MSASGSRTNRSDNGRRFRSAQLEEQLVRKRQAEYERINFWNNNSTYFKTWDFNTALHSQWMSNNASLTKFNMIENARKKAESLQQRRQKLKKLFDNEEQDFAKEIERSKKRPILLEDLNAANVELLLRQEEAKRRERDLKLYHYWRQNQPSLKEFERKQHSDYVKRSWIQQVIEKRKEKEAEEKKLTEHMAELKRLQKEYEMKDKELKEDRKKTELELKAFLDKQIALVKSKEEHEKILREEEKDIVRSQHELEEMIEERKRLEEKKKKIDLSLFNKRQYQLMLKKRAWEVHENLELDRNFLEKIDAKKEYEDGIRAERLEKFKNDLKMAREIFRKQAEIEKLRSSQAQYLFDEEAKKMYEEQEERWKKEDEARQKLLNDVLKTLQLQMKEKQLTNLEKQEKMREEREIMLKTVEQANRELQEHRLKTKKSFESFKRDLDQQIIEKKLEVFYRKKQQEEDKENELKAKREEEERLCKELYNMYVTGYQPKTAGRSNF